MCQSRIPQVGGCTTLHSKQSDAPVRLSAASTVTCGGIFLPLGHGNERCGVPPHVPWMIHLEQNVCRQHHHSQGQKITLSWPRSLRAQTSRQRPKPHSTRELAPMRLATVRGFRGCGGELTCVGRIYGAWPRDAGYRWPPGTRSKLQGSQSRRERASAKAPPAGGRAAGGGQVRPCACPTNALCRPASADIS
jgi:hypothetical protein